MGGAVSIKSVFIAGPPVPKARPRVVNGRTYTPKRTKEYEDRIGWAWREANLLYAQPSSGRVAVSIEVFEDKRVPQRMGDLDNYVKAALDALNGIAWKDDRQVSGIDARIERETPQSTCGLRVTVKS